MLVNPSTSSISRPRAICSPISVLASIFILSLVGDFKGPEGGLPIQFAMAAVGAIAFFLLALIKKVRLPSSGVAAFVLWGWMAFLITGSIGAVLDQVPLARYGRTIFPFILFIQGFLVMWWAGRGPRQSAQLVRALLLGASISFIATILWGFYWSGLDIFTIRYQILSPLLPMLLSISLVDLLVLRVNRLKALGMVLMGSTVTALSVTRGVFLAVMLTFAYKRCLSGSHADICVSANSRISSLVEAQKDLGSWITAKGDPSIFYSWIFCCWCYLPQSTDYYRKMDSQEHWACKQRHLLDPRGRSAWASRADDSITHFCTCRTRLWAGLFLSRSILAASLPLCFHGQVADGVMVSRRVHVVSANFLFGNNRRGNFPRGFARWASSCASLNRSPIGFWRKGTNWYQALVGRISRLHISARNWTYSKSIHISPRGPISRLVPGAIGCIGA